MAARQTARKVFPVIRIAVFLLTLACASQITLARFDSLQPQSPAFVLEETTIARIHAAFASRPLTCAQLARSYLDRIDAHDRKGPALRAIINVNPRAMEIAAAMDRDYGMRKVHPPLHCIPIILGLLTDFMGRDAIHEPRNPNSLAGAVSGFRGSADQFATLPRM